MTLSLPTRAHLAAAARTALLWAAAMATVAWLTRDGVVFAASSAPWLASLQAPAAGGWPKLMRAAVDLLPAVWRTDPLWGLRWLQLPLGAAVVVLALAVTRRAVDSSAGLPAAASHAAVQARRIALIAAIALLLAWPPARLALSGAGVELVWALALLAAAWASQGWQDQPLRAVVVAGTGAAGVVLSHPLGVVLGPALLLGLLLLPHRHDSVPAGAAASALRSGWQPGPRWLPWLATVLVAAAVVLWALRPLALKSWGSSQFALLRQPADSPRVGSWMVPVVGPWLVWLWQAPVGLGLLTWLAWRRGRRQPDGAAAGPLGVLAAAVVVLGGCGYPYPQGLDPLLVLAPLWVAVAATAIGQGLHALLAQFRPVAAAVWVLALLALVGSDVRLSTSADRRNALARHVIAPLQAVQPAHLELADLDLLQRFAEPVAVLPSQPAGLQLAMAALPLASPGRPEGASTARAVAPHAARLVLLPQPAVHAVDRVFAEAGSVVACRADGLRCLYRLVGRGAAARTATP